MPALGFLLAWSLQANTACRIGYDPIDMGETPGDQQTESDGGGGGGGGGSDGGLDPSPFLLQVDETELRTASDSVQVTGDCGPEDTLVRIEPAGRETRCQSGRFALGLGPVTVDGSYPFSVTLVGSALAPVEVTWVRDTSGPQIQSFALAGGAAFAALPIIDFDVVFEDASPVREYRLATTVGDLALAPWQSLDQPSAELSRIPGDKTLFLQVRDVLGNESEPSTDGIRLEPASPPIALVLEPDGATPFAAGDPVRIEWRCEATSIAGLGPLPVRRLSYVREDNGARFTVAENLANGMSPTTGRFDWTLPANDGDGSSLSGVPLRIELECVDAAGVVERSNSPVFNSTGWQILVGDPGFRRTDINAASANLSGEFFDLIGSPPVYQVRGGAVFTSVESAIVRIDPQSALVTRWAGPLAQGSCPEPTATTWNGAFRGVLIPFGLTRDESAMYVYDEGCSILYRVSTQNPDEVALWNRFPERIISATAIITADRSTLFFSYRDSARSRRQHRVSLATPNAPIESYFGTDTCAPPSYAVGDDASTMPLPACSGGGCPGEHVVIPNRDGSRLTIGWRCTGANPAGIVLERDGQGGPYRIAETSLGWDPGTRQNCVADGDSAEVFCRTRIDDGNRQLFRVDPEASTSDAMSLNFNTGAPGLGLGPGRLLLRFTDGRIESLALPTLDDRYAVAGRPATQATSDARQATLASPVSLTHAGGANALVVSDQNARLTVVDLSLSPRPSRTLPAPIDRFGLLVNVDATETGIWGTCALPMLRRYDLGTSARLQDFFHHCPPRPAGDYPPTTGAGVNSATFFRHGNGARVDGDMITASGGGVIVGGKAYFAARRRNRAEDYFILSSDTSVFERVAGRLGAPSVTEGVVPAASSALGRLIGLQAITEGPFAGDLLVLEAGARGLALRVVTLGSAPTGCAGGPCLRWLWTLADRDDGSFDVGAEINRLAFDHFDDNTLQSGVLSFMDDRDHTLHRIDVSGPPTPTARTRPIVLNAVELDARTRLAVTPLGLTLTEVGKNRVLLAPR